MQHALFQLLYAKQRVIFENNCSSFSFASSLRQRTVLSNNNTFAFPFVHLSFNRIAIEHNNSFPILSSLSSIIIRINALQNEFELLHFFSITTRHKILFKDLKD